jgi:hypothetical protein
MGFSFKLAIKRDYRQVAVAELMLAFFDAPKLSTHQYVPSDSLAATAHTSIRFAAFLAPYAHCTSGLAFLAAGSMFLKEPVELATNIELGARHAPVLDPTNVLTAIVVEP